MTKAKRYWLGDEGLVAASGAEIGAWVLADDYDALERDLATQTQQFELCHSALLKIRVALGLDLHGNDNLLDVIAARTVYAVRLVDLLRCAREHVADAVADGMNPQLLNEIDAALAQAPEGAKEQGPASGGAPIHDASVRAKGTYQSPPGLTPGASELDGAAGSTPATASTSTEPGERSAALREVATKLLCLSPDFTESEGEVQIRSDFMAEIDVRWLHDLGSTVMQFVECAPSGGGSARWAPFSEQLPTDGERVLVYKPTEPPHQSPETWRTIEFHRDNFERGWLGPITHWMALSAPCEVSGERTKP